MAGLFMKTVLLSLKIGAQPSKAYSCTLKAASVDAKAGTEVEYPTLSAGCVYRNVGQTTYALHLIGVQDWDPASSSGLAADLAANDGAAAAFWLQAHGEAVAASPATPAMTGNCTLIAPSYGGEVNKYAEFDVTLPITGKPLPATTGTPPALLDALVAGDEAAIAALLGIQVDELAGEPAGRRGRRMTDGADDDVYDLTAVARAHPARRVRLDIAALEAEALLSIGDIVDMAEKLHTEPAELAAMMRDGSASTRTDVGIAFAWIIGRKADPALSYDEVRTSWRIEPAETPPADPTPPTPPRAELATSSG